MNDNAILATNATIGDDAPKASIPEGQDKLFERVVSTRYDLFTGGPDEFEVQVATMGSLTDVFSLTQVLLDRGVNDIRLSRYTVAAP